MSAPHWDREGRDWPNRAASQFIRSGGLEWHVQIMGQGPVLLLLHGTGAATHSWRDLMPALADRFTLVAPDLPGHGFTRGRISGGPSLPGMARVLGDLIAQLGCGDPAMIVGHSAGAAIGLRYLIDHNKLTPLIGLTPALMPFPGLAAKLFPAMARALFVNPFAAMLFARIARTPGEAEKFLVRSTGSTIDDHGGELYARLFGCSEHCAGAVAMMANWDLEGLAADLPRYQGPVLLVHGQKDAAIPESAVRAASDLLPECVYQALPGLGHLAHEQDPAAAAALITGFAAVHGVAQPQADIQ